MTRGVGDPGPGGRRMGSGGGSFRGERVVGGSGAEIDNSDAGRGLDNKLPVSPSVTFGFFGFRAFLGGVFGKGDVREEGTAPEQETERKGTLTSLGYLQRLPPHQVWTSCYQALAELQRQKCLLLPFSWSSLF